MDPLLTHRRTAIRVDLLGADDRVKGRLYGVTGGGVDHNVHRAVHGTGSLTIREATPPEGWVGMGDVDLASDRVRIWWQVAGAEPWPLITALLDKATRRVAPGGAVWDVDLLDKMTILDQWLLPAYSIPQGSYVTDSAASMITGAGEPALAVTESDERLSAGLAWDAGTSRLRVINDLLDAAAYRGVATDGYGTYVLTPYVRPQDRPPSWAFTEGRYAIHSATWAREQDTHAVKNAVRLTSQASGDEHPMESVALNENPDSPYSIPSRDREITYYEGGVEATSQNALDAIAERKLIELSSPTATLTITHAPLPLRVNDVVTFTSQGHEAVGVITATTLALSPLAQQASTIREVVAL